MRDQTSGTLFGTAISHLAHSTCILTWFGIHHGRFEPASPIENHGDASWIVSTPRSTALVLLHLFKPILSSLRAPSLLVWRDGDARDMSLPSRHVLIAPPLVGVFCRSEGAQSTTQSWRDNPLTLSCHEAHCRRPQAPLRLPCFVADRNGLSISPCLDKMSVNMSTIPCPLTP